MESTLQIVVEALGISKTQKELESLSDSAKKVADSVDVLGNVLGALGSYFAAEKLVQFANKWGELQGKVTSVSSSLDDAREKMEGVFAIAQNSRQGLQGTVELFQRISLAAGELGANSAKVSQFVDTINKTLTINKIDPSRAADAMLQMSQALALGTVRSEEFNSVGEVTPQILQMVARHVDGAHGSINRLRQIMLAGKLSSKEFFDAILKETEQVNEKFKTSPITFAQAFTVMENAFLKFIGDVENATGVIDKLSRSIIYLGSNLHVVIPAVIGLGTALLALKGGAITGVIDKFVALFALIARNPIAILIGAIVGVLSYLTVMQDKLRLTKDGLATVADAFTILSATLDAQLAKLVDGISALWSQTTQAFGKIADSLGINVSNWYGAFAEFYKGVGTGWKGVVLAIARTWDFLTAGYAATWAAIGKGFKLLFIDPVLDMLGKIGQAFQKWWGYVKRGPEGFLDMWSDAFSAVGKAATDSAKFVADVFKGEKSLKEAFVPDFNDLKSRWNNYAKEVSNEFTTVFNRSMENSVEGFFRDVFKDAEQLAQARSKIVKDKPVESVTKLPPQVDEKAIAKFKRDLQSLLDKLDPIGRANREFAEGQKILNQAFKQGSDELKKYSDLLVKAYEKARDPFSFKIQDLEFEKHLLNVHPILAEQKKQYQAIVEELRIAGVHIEKNSEKEKQIKQLLEETAIARERNVRWTRLQAESQYSLLENTRKELEAINFLRDTDKTYIQRDVKKDVNKLYGVEQENGYYQQMEQMREYYRQVEELQRQDVANTETYELAKAAIRQRQRAIEMGAASDFFGTLATLQSSGVKEVARIGKAAAISQAIINGIGATVKAYEQGGPILGPAMAAAVGAATAAQIAAMRQQSVGFMTGGSFNVGGRGGADSQMVAFRATPGERVTVQTPQQVRKGQAGMPDGSGSNIVVTPKIVNVFDSSVVSDYMRSSEGERLIVNVMSKNRKALGV